MADPEETADRVASSAVRLLGLAVASGGAFYAEQSRLLGAAAVLVGLAVFLFPRQARGVGEDLTNVG
ncbi:hypothetical protein SAMN04487947_0708 [Halogeometricum rufum]|uniref:Uncharacterized protein n=1 Tax=Halogeometricum rufum TaxID=553469 RepID=A0A1I6G809_9EURY|nr:hypothetical protein [Halogeometricum rufum]SFR38314.1 hypothetical protein SAMN04487947_0708 [Halogeometricum rufum]